MTKQTQPYIFKTCEKTFPGKPGYSGWVPIIESGIQVHTSSNNRFVSVDVYSCQPFEREDVESFVRSWFKPEFVETVIVEARPGHRQPRPAGRHAFTPAFDRTAPRSDLARGANSGRLPSVPPCTFAAVPNQRAKNSASSAPTSSGRSSCKKWLQSGRAVISVCGRSAATRFIVFATSGRMRSFSP